MCHSLYHKHFSSKYARIVAGVEGMNVEYDCPTCGEDEAAGMRHMNDTMGRIKLCLSSSTIHEFWKYRGFISPDNHIDFITSPGARIEDLMEIFKIEYAEVERGCDILLVAGLNNVKDEDETKIMERIRAFHQVVTIQSEAYHPNDPSTFAVATLLYPGKYCWFVDDGALPSQYYVNKLAMMTKLNNLIKTFNDSVLQMQKSFYQSMLGDEWDVVREKSLAPAFHTFGVRKRNVKKGNKTVGKTNHRWSWWRETEAFAKKAEEDGSVIPAVAKANTLHLTDVHRGRMAKDVDNYYSKMFTPYDFNLE